MRLWMNEAPRRWPALAAILWAGCAAFNSIGNVRAQNLALGKVASQVNTWNGYPASDALDYKLSIFSMTVMVAPEVWWQVDLRGYYRIDNITLTATTNHWHKHMRNARVSVTDKDMSLCPNVQIEFCGNVSSTTTAGESFPFDCPAAFPVRYVRVVQATTSYLSIGYIDVRGSPSRPTQRYYYATTDKMISQPFESISVVSSVDCSVHCYMNNECIDFSFNPSVDRNCLLTNTPVPMFTTNAAGWTLYTLEDCFSQFPVGCSTL